MVEGYWKGIVISVLLVGSVIYFAWGRENVYNVDYVVEILLKAEDQIRKTDKRISFIRQVSSDNSDVKYTYKTIIVAAKGQRSMAKLTDAEIEDVFEKFQLYLNKYETDELFKDVRNAAEKLKKHREDLHEVKMFQNTIECNNCDLQKLGSIKFNELQSSHDKSSFDLIFQDALDKLRNLNMMTKDSSIKNSEALENLVINFNEGFTNIAENEFDEFKKKSIKALSEFVVRIKNELQNCQTVATKYLNKNAVKEITDELVLKFRIAIVKVFQTISDEY